MLLVSLEVLPQALIKMSVQSIFLSPYAELIIFFIYFRLRQWSRSMIFNDEDFEWVFLKSNI